MLLCAFGGFVARTAARLKDSTACTVRQHAVSASEAVATADYGLGYILPIATSASLCT
jgi:hypothetical protein